MKRLILLCDGTWLDADTPSRESNVLRLARAIAPQSAKGVSQVLYYQPGPRPDESFSALGAEAYGRGIDQEIQSLYRFLVLNWAAGDELFLFGFCRGAYIARSLVGMLRNAWLLQRGHEADIAQAYHVYRTHWHPDAENALGFRADRAREIRVRFLGAWDTIGALGIPLDLLPGFDAERYNFHDTRLGRLVDHACHALAIDERRQALAPCPWRTRADRTRTEQAWFSGSHADIGGGPRETGLADISLRWMAEQAARAGLAIDAARLEAQMGEDAREIVHGWISPAMRRLGLAWRGIGEHNHDETLHSSAEQRALRDPDYRPRNLREYLARDEQIRLPI